jgi:hypothetical protein
MLGTAVWPQLISSYVALYAHRDGGIIEEKGEGDGIEADRRGVWRVLANAAAAKRPWGWRVARAYPFARARPLGPRSCRAGDAWPDRTAWRG